jgi:hypothetical protein
MVNLVIKIFCKTRRLTGTGKELLNEPHVKAAYLGG